MGAVDMTADKTPYETAQKLADDRAASFTCGKDTPVVVGPPTRWTAALIESATKHD